MKSLSIIALAAALALGACASGTTGGTALTQSQVQSDVTMALYLLQATGCAAASLSAAAAPVIAVSADAKGNQVLQAISASGAVACQMTVPSTALPVPAPANAPAATVTASAS